MPRPFTTIRTGRSLSAGLALLFAASPAARGAAVAQEEQGYDVRRDIVYASPGGRRLRLDAYVPDSPGPHPAVLVVHGGAWMIGDKNQLAFMARALAGRGHAAFAINYRLAPAHRSPAQIEDCRSAVRWMLANAKRFKVDAARLGAIGYSAGGQLVALLGVQGVELEAKETEEGKERTKEGTEGGRGEEGAGAKEILRFSAVVPGGAPCEFRTLPLDSTRLAYWLGGTRREKPRQYHDASPLAFVGPESAPMFFYNGGRDLLVPPASARAMVAALGKAGVDADVHIVKGKGHIPALFDADALQKAYAFLDERLGRSRAPAK